MSTETDLFAGAGVGAVDESVLRALLTRPEATVAELAEICGQPPDVVAVVLDRLCSKGLAARLAGDQPRWTAAGLETALDALLLPAEQALRRAREAATELAALFRASRAEGRVTGPVEVVTGREEVSRCFLRLQESAVREVCHFDRPPYVHAVGNPAEPSVLARGVLWRAIYHPDSLDCPGALTEIRKLIALGEQARVLADVPFKMYLVDGRVGMLALDDDTATVRAAVVHPSTLLDALVKVFESCWARATPLDGVAGDEPTLSNEDRQLLVLLAAGVKDEAIARQMGLSVRTLRRRMRRLLDLLGAQTRFQAGMQAARRGWI